MANSQNNHSTTPPLAGEVILRDQPTRSSVREELDWRAERVRRQPRAERSGMSWLTKFALLAAGTVFLVLGIVGLVMPFLPGVLFLGVALYFFARSSRWLRHRIEASPRLSGLLIDWDAARGLPWLARVRLLGLLTVRGILRLVGGSRGSRRI